jgi:RHS repeat-associated protein
MTDATGRITEAYAYDPFGRPINGQVSANCFRYLGRHGVMDEQNGLLYVRARYYSTKRGRFITKDPTTGKDGDSQSMNRYIYALNNPVRLIDISGLSAQESSGTTLQLATSDSMFSHNWLISPSTAGFNTLIAGSTPQFQTGGFNISDPRISNRILGIGDLTYTIASEEAQAGRFLPNQIGLVNSLGKISLGLTVAEDISEQIGNTNFKDINSVASSAQAVAANVLVDFTGVNAVFKATLGTDVHVTGSDLFQAEHSAAISIVTEELALPCQIMNGYMYGINASGNWLYQTTGF